MPATEITSSQLHRDPSRAVRAADSGPVFITTYGKATHVIVTIESFDTMTAERLAEAEAAPLTEADGKTSL